MNILGWTFLILGILGMVFPVLQGLLFTIIGLFILSDYSPWAKRLLQKLRNRYPKMSAKSDRFLKKLKWKSTS
ncbi:PGPGW domain-containing protein [Paenactinomyces guangxiensis]